MAHLFCTANDDVRASRAREDWVVLPLEGHGVRLSPAPRRVLPDGDPSTGVDRDDVCIVRDESEWVLLVGPARRVDVNGMPLVHGIRVLADRDEIHIDDEPACFFSTETLPSVEPYNGPESACMRCRLMLDTGRPAVRCPVCRIWHHEDAKSERSCWTGFERCASCGHSTSMDAGFRFCPEDL